MILLGSIFHRQHFLHQRRDYRGLDEALLWPNLHWQREVLCRQSELGGWKEGKKGSLDTGPGRLVNGDYVSG